MIRRWVNKKYSGTCEICGADFVLCGGRICFQSTAGDKNDVCFCNG